MRKFFTFVLLFTLNYVFGQCPAGSTVLSNENFATSLPSGWASVNGNATNTIYNSGGYVLLEIPSGGNNDIVTTSAFNVASCSSVTLQFSVGTFGSGTNNPGTVSFDFDMGTDPPNVTTATPTSSTYISAFATPHTLTVPSGATTLTISITNNGTSGRGLRVDNFVLCCVSNVCNITAISTSSPSACNDNGTPNDASDDYYTVNVSVTYANAPASGNLVLSGDVLTGGGALSQPIGTSPQVFTGIRVKADGTPTSITATFDSQSTCTFTNTTAHAGLPPCSIGACPTMLGAMVNACEDMGMEGDNEFVLFQTNETLTAGAYTVNYGTSSPPNSNDLCGSTATNASCPSCITAPGCGSITHVTSASTSIPSGSYVVFIPATNQQPYNLSGLCAGSNLYVVYIDLSGCTSWTSGGTLSNSPSGPRFFQITSTSCNSSSSPIQSYNDSWSSNSNGNYVSYESGSAVYTNNGCSAPVIMPVETKYLNVYKKGKTVELLWATASETNNSHFNIERSADTRNFETIGEIKGAGNSSKELSYEYIDEKPLTGLNYYRIKQTDFDGRFSYSEIRSVRFKGLNNVNVTPRTTEGQINITTDLEAYTIDIHNAAGQVVKTFPAMGLDQTISIESLVAGVYFVKINSRSESETVRIVKI